MTMKDIMRFCEAFSGLDDFERRAIATLVETGRAEYTSRKIWNTVRLWRHFVSETDSPSLFAEIERMQEALRGAPSDG